MKAPIDIPTILKEFHAVSGFRISIHDADFNEIYAYPTDLSPYCRIIQQNKDNRRQCIRNDRLAFESVRDSGEVAVYRCSHGLYEAVAPIYHYGILSGYFMIGQVCDDKRSNGEQLYRSIYDVLSDEKQAAEVVDSVKEVPQQLIDSYILLMTVIAEYVTKSNILPGNSMRLASMTMQYLQQNYASKITLSSLADQFFCSQSLLIKSFRKEYGTTIITALTDIRLKKAKELLLGSRMRVKEIAETCGFSEQNYFSKAFVAKYGCSPSDFRKHQL